MKEINKNDIIDITLLSVDEAEAVPIEVLQSTRAWWLRSPGYTSYDAAYVNIVGSIYGSGSDVNDSDIGVRPALIINNHESLNLQLGEKVGCLNRTWFYVGDNLILFEYIIDFRPFNSSKEKGNDFSSSDIKRYLDDTLAKWLAGDGDVTKIKPELKPCPFCGGAAILEACINDPDGGFYVHCSKCEIEQLISDVEETAIERWNRRVKE